MSTSSSYRRVDMQDDTPPCVPVDALASVESTVPAKARDHFVCAVCQEWPHEPHVGMPIDRAQSCQHVLCGICTRSILSGSCPVCRTPATFVPDTLLASAVPIDAAGKASLAEFVERDNGCRRRGQYRLSEAMRVCHNLEMTVNTVELMRTTRDMLLLAMYHDHVAGAAGQNTHLRRLALYGGCDIICVPTADHLPHTNAVYAPAHAKARPVSYFVIRVHACLYHITIIGPLPLLRKRCDSVESVLFSPPDSPAKKSKKRARAE